LQANSGSHVGKTAELAGKDARGHQWLGQHVTEALPGTPARSWLANCHKLDDQSPRMRKETYNPRLRGLEACRR